jgi:hypothetical protein
MGTPKNAADQANMINGKVKLVKQGTRLLFYDDKNRPFEVLLKPQEQSFERSASLAP